MGKKDGNTEDRFWSELASFYDARSDELKDTAPIFSGLKPEEPLYQAHTLLARGGMKTVLKVFDPKTGRHVALAKLNPGSPEELYEPFLREARLTALLDHPNIITVYDIGLSEESSPYFTMELKTGHSLEQIISDHFSHTSEVDLNELLNIFLKICDAIDYAHSQKVIHLDLKPGNIQIGQHGEVIVCDWGLGKLIGHKDYDGGEFDRLLLNPDLLNNMTLSGRIKGTPGFMAPEQVTADGDKTCRTDIYALGALLYNLLTNQLPVEGETTDELLKNTRNGKIINPAKRVPDRPISSTLSAIAMKALATDPADRYTSVRALSNDLTHYLSGYSTSAEETGVLKEIRLFCRRNRLVVSLSGLFMLLLFTAITISFISIRKSERSAVTAFQQLQQEKQKRQRLGREAAPAFHQRALTALSDGKIDEAFRLVKTAATLDSDHEEAQNLLASLYFINDDYVSARQTFKPFTQSLYRQINRLTKRHLEGTQTAAQEYAEIESLLNGCAEIIPTPLSTALFLNWIYDERPEYRELALRNFVINKEMCSGILNYASLRQDHGSTDVLVTRVLQVLTRQPDWIGRRIPASLGLKITRKPQEKMQFAALIPANLALGQPVISKGVDKTDPIFVNDGIRAGKHYWEAGSIPSHVTIDLGDVHIISELKIFTNRFAQKGDRFKYIISISTTGNVYSQIIDRDFKHDTELNVSEHSYSIPPSAARFIRLKIQYHNGETPVQIREIEVY